MTVLAELLDPAAVARLAALRMELARHPAAAAAKAARRIATAPQAAAAQPEPVCEACGQRLPPPAVVFCEAAPLTTEGPR